MNSNRLPVLGAAIKRLHDESESAAKTAIERAIEAGHVLIEAKGLIEHGGWLPFLAEAGIPKRTAQRWMALAEGRLESDTVTHLGGVKEALVFLSMRRHAMCALAKAEVACIQGSTDDGELIEPLHIAIDTMQAMAVMLKNGNGE